MYPTSPLGRTIAIVLMFSGIIVIALPVGVIGSSFSKAFEEMEEKDRAEQLRQLEDQSVGLEDEVSITGLGREGTVMSSM